MRYIEIFLALLMATPVLAAQNEGDITIVVRNEEVAQVFQILESISGRKVLAEPAVLKSKARVSFRVAKTTKATALTFMLFALRKQAGIQLVSEAGNYRATLVASPDRKPN